MRAGKALFTGEKESSMLLNIIQLLGPLDWGETVVEDNSPAGKFTYTAAKDLKQCVPPLACASVLFCSARAVTWTFWCIAVTS
jgi:hypothetical protein